MTGLAGGASGQPVSPGKLVTTARGVTLDTYRNQEEQPVEELLAVGGALATRVLVHAVLMVGTAVSVTLPPYLSRRGVPRVRIGRCFAWYSIITPILDAGCFLLVTLAVQGERGPEPTS
jgi:hypothetical protein